MATKNIKKGKNSANAVDPFATVAEPSRATTPPQKITRPIKVIKAAKPAAPVAAASEKSQKSKPEVRPAVTDAFAELAKTSVEDDVKLALPARSQKRKPTTGSAKASTAKPVPRTERQAPARKQPARPDTTTPAAVARVDKLPERSREIAKAEPEVELSPVFKALADVKLPELPRENRARLQMQSPTRLYFYWSLRQNPWQQLRSVVGPELGSYRLIIKLRNLTAATEEIHPIETQGEWWFNDAEPEMEYMAEIGFYATNRPYFRVLYSNAITTPRRGPSTHPATESRWTVSATKFAEVLDASGFTRDAVEVAIAGDDHLDAEQRTNLAFSYLMRGVEYSAKGIAAEDMRHAILALAGGATMETLRHRVSPSLVKILKANAERLSASVARNALTRHFEVADEEWTEHEFGSSVFGASLVSFPKTLRPRTSSRYKPVSSFTLGR